MILQAMQQGTSSDYYPRFIKNNKVKANFSIQCSKEDEDKILSYLIRQLYKPYDFAALLGFLWVIANRSFGRNISNPFPSKSSYYCSELMVRALQEIKFPGTDRIDPNLVSPEDLLEFLSNHPLAQKL